MNIFQEDRIWFILIIPNIIFSGFSYLSRHSLYFKCTRKLNKEYNPSKRIRTYVILRRLILSVLPRGYEELHNKAKFYLLKAYSLVQIFPKRIPY